MRNKFFVPIVVFLVAVCAGVAIYYAKNSALPPPPSIPKETFIRPYSPVYGVQDSKVLVVEWFDPECESCRLIHPTFKKIVSDYQDRVQFALRYMPYHGNSLYVASVLEEARELGKFEAALDIVFDKQPEWGSHHNPQPELISGYLAKIGIPAERTERGYVVNKHESKIRQDEADGLVVRVIGTPAFFVNGRRVGKLGDSYLREAIDKALAASR